MMEPRRLTFVERSFAGLMNFLGRLSEGYTVDFTEELIRQYGIRGFIEWAKHSQAAWKRLVSEFGESDAHLLAAFASLWNGCHYCAQGHLLAHNLELFRDHGTLFPLDESSVLELLRMSDSQILASLREALSGPYEPKRRLLERQYLLKTALPEELAAAPGDPALDEKLQRANALYEWINECSITSESDPPPMGPVAKDKELRIRYREARARQRQAAPAQVAVTSAVAAAR